MEKYTELFTQISNFFNTYRDTYPLCSTFIKITIEYLYIYSYQFVFDRQKTGAFDKKLFKYLGFQNTYSKISMSKILHKMNICYFHFFHE